jgi:hypothetical protein
VGARPRVSVRVDPGVRGAARLRRAELRRGPWLLARLDQCVAAAIAANEVGLGRPLTRGDMVRMLVLCALPQVEAEYGLTERAAVPRAAVDERGDAATVEDRGCRSPCPS